ncbi:MAG: hypothetical protein VYC34_01400, partial [Planctomycetota bacterium]|nr:hypothetical protein [Planctomycetota bacterium]
FLSLFYLDPLAGLSPAKRELAQSRMLAERAFFFAQRMPTVVRWQAEVLVMEALALPEVQKTIAAADSVSKSAETTSDAANRIVAMIPEERKAAIDQVFAHFDDQRAALIDALDEDGAASAALTEIRLSIEAAERLAISSERAANASESVVEALGAYRRDRPADKPPFDVNEYRDALDSAADAVAELRALVESLDPLIASESWTARKAELNDAARWSESLVDRIFYRGLILIVVAALCFTAAAIFIRRRAA